MYTNPNMMCWIPSHFFLVITVKPYIKRQCSSQDKTRHSLFGKVKNKNIRHWNRGNQCLIPINRERCSEAGEKCRQYQPTYSFSFRVKYADNKTGCSYHVATNDSQFVSVHIAVFFYLFCIKSKTLNTIMFK